MSHEIETNGDQAAAMFAREDAWHKLGTTVAEAFTAEDAMSIAHLGGWNVRKEALTTASGLIVPGAFATVRDNPWTAGQVDVLGVVGSGYKPVQNEEHAAFLNALVGESGAIFDTAGSLKDGKETFISMRLPESITVGGTDRVDLNIVALNSHDGKTAFRTLVSPVRVVCANTQRAALGNHTGSYSVRHTTNALNRIAQAREALGLTFKFVEEFDGAAERMIQTEMTNAEFDRMVGQLFPAPKETDTDLVKRNHRQQYVQLRELWDNSPTQTLIKGTRWAGYQTLTEYTDHYMPIRTGWKDRQAARADRTFKPAIQLLKQQAWELTTV